MVLPEDSAWRPTAEAAAYTCPSPGKRDTSRAATGFSAASPRQGGQWGGGHGITESLCVGRVARILSCFSHAPCLT